MFFAQWSSVQLAQNWTLNKTQILLPPRVGRDLFKFEDVVIRDISIHPPRVGRDHNYDLVIDRFLPSSIANDVFVISAITKTFRNNERFSANLLLFHVSFMFAR